MATHSQRRNRAARTVDCHDRSAHREAASIDRLHAVAPRRKDARITSGIPWSPVKPSGQTGWIRLSEKRRLRATVVRNASNRTPKLVNTYVRCFSVVTYQ